MYDTRRQQEQICRQDGSSFPFHDGLGAAALVCLSKVQEASVNEDPMWQEDLGLLISRTRHWRCLVMDYMVLLGLRLTMPLSLSW